MSSKRKTLTTCLVVSFMLLCGSLGVFVTLGKNSAGADTKQVSTGKTEYASISPIVCDGITNQPIKNATIVIPETGYSTVTNSTGSVGRIKVPVIPDPRFDKMVKKPWGEITILVYCEGYRPYTLFYTEVFPNEDREGPTIYIYPGEEDETEPFSLIEGPNPLWVNDIIEKYRP